MTSQSKATGRKKNRRILQWGLGFALVAAVAFLLASGPIEPEPEPIGAPAAELTTPSPEDEAAPLLGRWKRPDGGYIIEIREAQPGGNLDAAYFNPRPINVSRAAWIHGGGRLQVFVELRDTGYPGATYVLHYDPGNDTLVGDYTQPASQQTFGVEFVRMNE